MLLLACLLYFILLLPIIMGDSGTWPGLTEHASPRLLIAGSVKAGTNFLWNMLRTCHMDFIASDRNGALSSMDTEFNVAFRAQRYVDDLTPTLLPRR